LVLVKSDGVSVANAFNPYPSVAEDVAYGVAQQLITTALLSTTVPQVLVPTSAADLPPDWNQRAFVPTTKWTNGSAPPAFGFDTNQPSPAPANLARGGTALQSTTLGANTANLAIDGNTANVT